MENQHEPGRDLVVRKSGEMTPWNAGDVMAATVDICRASGIPVIVPRYRGILARNAKELLEGGVPPHTIVAAAVLAVRRSEPHRLQWIAMDLMLGTNRLSRHEYEQALRDEIEILRWQEQREGKEEQ